MCLSIDGIHKKGTVSEARSVAETAIPSLIEFELQNQKWLRSSIVFEPVENEFEARTARYEEVDVSELYSLAKLRKRGGEEMA
jgi:hypothetical protein